LISIFTVLLQIDITVLLSYGYASSHRATIFRVIISFILPALIIGVLNFWINRFKLSSRLSKSLILSNYWFSLAC
jgi:hypothetical protein